MFVAVAFVTYGVPRILRPDRYPGENFLTGVISDVNRALLHFDFGNSVILPGHPPVHGLWVDGLMWDLWLITGGLLIGAFGGVAAGIWCSRHPRALRSRLVEWAAMAAFCSPIFFTGLFILFLFNSTYGRIPLPWFFDAEPSWAQLPGLNGGMKKGSSAWRVVAES